jgi:hypothetical protein
MSTIEYTPQKQLLLFDDSLIPYNVTHIPLSKNGKYAGKYEAVVDAIDADLADWWWAVVNMSNMFPHAIHNKGGRKNRIRFWMHRVIMERILDRPLEPGEFIDHINGNGLDNRRSNLRLASIAQNNMNTRRRSTNTSGYKGVSWKKDKQKWSVEIHVDKRKFFLGYFDNPADGYEVYCEAAKKLHGEFARLD